MVTSTIYCAVLTLVALVNSPPSTQPATPTHSELSPKTIYAQIASAGLPPVNYSFHSVRRFLDTASSLDEKTRRELTQAISDFLTNNPDHPELPHLLFIRAQIVKSLGQNMFSVPWAASLLSDLAAHREGIHQMIESLDGKKSRLGDSAFQNLILRLDQYPQDPALGQLWKRYLATLPEGPTRDECEKAFLDAFPDSPSAKQLAAEKSIDQPLSTPFTLPEDKPTLLHFYTPNTKWGEAHLQALKDLQSKHKDQFHLQLIPVPETPDAFTASQGLTQADIPLTYLLDKDHTLKSIRHDDRLEKPLQRLLGQP